MFDRSTILEDKTLSGPLLMPFVCGRMNPDTGEIGKQLLHDPWYLESSVFAMEFDTKKILHTNR
jgi:hypothetical protein